MTPVFPVGTRHLTPSQTQNFMEDSGGPGLPEPLLCGIRYSSHSLYMNQPRGFCEISVHDLTDCIRREEVTKTGVCMMQKHTLLYAPK